MLNESLNQSEFDSTHSQQAFNIILRFQRWKSTRQISRTKVPALKRFLSRQKNVEIFCFSQNLSAAFHKFSR